MQSRVFSLFLSLCLLGVSATSHASSWYISATRAKNLYQQGAIVLDTRPHKHWNKQHIKTSLPLSWTTFSPNKQHHKGTLLPLRRLNKRLSALGIRKNKAILVVGNGWHGWGEDGRIVWMLRSLGLKRVYFVNGGFQAAKKAGFSMTNKKTTPKTSTFKGNMRSRWSISRETLRKIIKHKRKGWVFIDTRERREYKGKTPYGEKRGGHLPGALHLHFKRLMNKKGMVRSKKAIETLLSKKGITKKSRIVAYCTGGIRSAWFVAVLQSLGYKHAKNYAGSMWEWSHHPAKTHPLEKN